MNLFLKLMRLWSKFKKQKCQETTSLRQILVLSVRSQRTSAVEKNNERITWGIADFVAVIHLYICIKDWDAFPPGGH